MKVIKFRAWVNHYGKMAMIYSDDSWHYFWDLIEKDIEPMQYTGLHDKRGKGKKRKEIYEGDIVLWFYSYDDFDNHGFPCTFHREVKGIIVYQDCAFQLKHLTIDGHTYHYTKISELEKDGTYTIIGNIHEDPELLK